MVNLNDYRRLAKPVIKQWCDEKKDVPPYKHVSELALYIPCPCIAVCCYMIELYGENPEIIGLLDKLKTFYKEEHSDILKSEG